MHPWDAIWIFVILSSLQPVAQKLLLAQSNLLSWSWIRKRAGVARSARDQELPRLLRGPASVRVRGAACDVHAPAAEFEKEDHVEASEPERLDREKVAGDDRVGVRTQEVAPAELGTIAGRRHARVPQDRGDRRRADAHADTASTRRNSRYSNDTTKKQPPSTRVREADSTAATKRRGASNHRMDLRTQHAPADCECFLSGFLRCARASPATFRPRMNRRVSRR